MSQAEGKAYCKDCKYMRWLTTHDPCYQAGDWACRTSVYYGHTYFRCKAKNPDGSCVDYKRKWWKIWK